MKPILGGIFLSVLFFGCRQAQEPPRAAIALCCAASEGSKAEALTADDEIAVFACAEGTEDYFLEAAKFIVDADGRSLSYGSAVYYPDPKEAVRFFAYFPYHIGTFNVPMEQSTTEALKQADLCGAMASNTPVATPVSLEFRHLLARLVIATNEPTTRVVFPNALSGGSLDVPTGIFKATTRSDISTTGDELIVPAQPLSRLVLTVANVEYVFEPTLAITLETGKTTTLDLTLHPNTKTATLSGSSVTDWELVKTEGSPSHAVSNTLTLHWPKCHPRSNAVDSIILTITDGTTDAINYTVASGISYTNQTFTIPFASVALHYPYAIVSVALYQKTGKTWLYESPNVLGGLIAKSGPYVVGIRQPLNPPTEDDYVTINGVNWAKGHLVALNNRECKVGAPADGGLYFQFGSLIGWKGGANGSGSGACTGDGTLWGGVGRWDSFANQAYVWPAEMSATPSNWPVAGAGNLMNQWHFSYNQPPWGVPSTASDIGMFAVSLPGDKGSGTLRSGRYASSGVGDPCTYYLGSPWRLPTGVETSALFGNATSFVPWPQSGFSWVISPTIGAQRESDPILFFPASGFRAALNATFSHIGEQLRARTGSVVGYNLLGADAGVHPVERNSLLAAFPIRCVSSVAP